MLVGKRARAAPALPPLIPMIAAHLYEKRESGFAKLDLGRDDAHSMDGCIPDD